MIEPGDCSYCRESEEAEDREDAEDAEELLRSDGDHAVGMATMRRASNPIFTKFPLLLSET